MRRAILGLTIAAGLLVAVGVTSTAAAPAPSTTVVLSCDRGVGTAQATVQLKDSLFGTTFDTVILSCGPDSTSGLKSERTKVFTGAAGAFNATNISVTNAVGTGGCGIGSVAPATVRCDPNSGPGVKLTVR